MLDRFFFFSVISLFFNRTDFGGQDSVPSHFLSPSTSNISVEEFPLKAETSARTSLLRSPRVMWVYHPDKSRVTHPADRDRASLVLGGCLHSQHQDLVASRSLSAALPLLRQHCGHLFPVRPVPRSQQGLSSCITMRLNREWKVKNSREPSVNAFGAIVKRVMAHLRDNMVCLKFKMAAHECVISLRSSFVSAGLLLSGHDTWHDSIMKCLFIVLCFKSWYCFLHLDFLHAILGVGVWRVLAFYLINHNLFLINTNLLIAAVVSLWHFQKASRVLSCLRNQQVERKKNQTSSCSKVHRERGAGLGGGGVDTQHININVPIHQRSTLRANVKSKNTLRRLSQGLIRHLMV